MPDPNVSYVCIDGIKNLICIICLYNRILMPTDDKEVLIL